MSFGYQILGFGSGVSGVSASADQGRTGDYSTYKVFVFTGSGTFTVTGGDLTGVDIAVIAGGGGGQQTYAGAVVPVALLSTPIKPFLQVPIR